jgi:hypothetical protein
LQQLEERGSVGCCSSKAKTCLLVESTELDLCCSCPASTNIYHLDCCSCR